MKQLVQLQAQKAAFDAAGISIVAITYDKPELQRQFVDSFAIEYPLLSDLDAQSMKALGVLHADYEPGDSAYGIPYPGIFYVNAQQKIVAKDFLEGYQTRIDAAAVLAKAQQVL